MVVRLATQIACPGLQPRPLSPYVCTSSDGKLSMKQKGTRALVAGPWPVALPDHRRRTNMLDLTVGCGGDHRRCHLPHFTCNRTGRRTAPTSTDALLWWPQFNNTAAPQSCREACRRQMQSVSAGCTWYSTLHRVLTTCASNTLQPPVMRHKVADERFVEAIHPWAASAGGGPHHRRPFILVFHPRHSSPADGKCSRNCTAGWQQFPLVHPGFRAIGQIARFWLISMWQFRL